MLTLIEKPFSVGKDTFLGNESPQVQTFFANLLSNGVRRKVPD